MVVATKIMVLSDRGREISDCDEEAIPSPHSLVKEKFRAVKCVLGNHIGAALSIEGDLWA
jgi:hypothetical protein